MTKPKCVTKPKGVTIRKGMTQPKSISKWQDLNKCPDKPLPPVVRYEWKTQECDKRTSIKQRTKGRDSIKWRD